MPQSATSIRATFTNRTTRYAVHVRLWTPRSTTSIRATFTNRTTRYAVHLQCQSHLPENRVCKPCAILSKYVSAGAEGLHGEAHFSSAFLQDTRGVKSVLVLASLGQRRLAVHPTIDAHTLSFFLRSLIFFRYNIKPTLSFGTPGPDEQLHGLGMPRTLFENIDRSSVGEASPWGQKDSGPKLPPRS